MVVVTLITAVFFLVHWDRTVYIYSIEIASADRPQEILTRSALFQTDGCNSDDRKRAVVGEQVRAEDVERDVDQGATGSAGTAHYNNYH